MKRLVPHRLNGLQRLHTLATTSTAALCLALVSMASTGYAADTPPPAKPALPSYHAASKPITDKVGNKLIIIDFVKTAQDSYPGKLTESFDPKKTRHHPQVLNLVQDYEARYGFKRAGMTSWVGASVSAFLNSQQIERLRGDTNVRLITEDEVQPFSANPPWYPAWNGTPWTELRDWGHVAVNGKTVLPGSQRKVYIIDSGVAFHDDLGSVSDRFVCSAYVGANETCTNTYGDVRAVGCYAHSTHVAGIIGATAGNGQTRMGVYAGVNMVSMGTGTLVTASCGDTQGGPSLTAIGHALDYIKWSNIQWSFYTPNVPIVNLSANSGGMGFDANGGQQTNQSKVVELVTPVGISGWTFYPGAVFVQSAGNGNQDACGDTNALPKRESRAYQIGLNQQTTQVDGVLVVGAIGNNGTLATPINASEPLGITDPELGTNYGNCVDIWAPGQGIYSTWGRGSHGDTSYYGPDPLNPYQPYSGGQSSTYVWSHPWTYTGTSTPPAPMQGWAWLSGTSMAAPHVAAAAAYIADKYQLTTPIAIEQKVRDEAFTYAGRKIVYLPD
ncbi:MAG: S8 family serine peptidase [Burkholderiales bacterium]|nr:S8 family serine peptidase [Burkholderiales bacterium]